MKPKSVDVIGQKMTIEYRDPTQQLDLGSGHATGRTSLAYQKIVIDRDQGPLQLRDTVLHEVLHACVHVLEPAAEDEEQVARLTPVLLHVLRNNPKLVKWLTK